MRDSLAVSVGIRPVQQSSVSIDHTHKVGVYEHKQANVFTPSMFIAQLPQIPSRQLRRKVSVGSTSFLIRINASNIIGPVLFKSSVYVCIFGLAVGSSGDQR